MKKRLMHGGILLGVFLLALVFFSVITNRGNEDATADMTSAMLPTVSFTCENYEIDHLAGYVDDMQVVTMRDTILPILSDGKITANLNTYGTKVEGLSYAVLSLDGKTSYLEGKGALKNVSGEIDSYELDTKDAFEKLDPETQLTLKVMVKVKKETIHYYTRIVIPQTSGAKACLDFAQNIHDQAMGNVEVTTLGSLLETSSDAPAGFQKVTIQSSYDQMTWAGLDPQIEGDMQIDLTESNSVYSSIRMRYRVSCTGEKNQRETFDVEEFFRVRGNSGKLYLLNYQRTMDQILNVNQKVLSDKGILLGLSDDTESYMANGDGTQVSFVKNRELYAYNQEEDQLVKVFSFEDAEKNDLRALNRDHNIRILNVKKNGSTVFAVCGYMSRGNHEGRVGETVYYYDSEKNGVEEKVFIPSNASYAFSREDFEKFIYYDADKGTLYLLNDGNLYETKAKSGDLQEKDMKKLVSGLKEGQYAGSFDGQYLAYRSEEKGADRTQVTVRNLADDSSYTVEAAEEETLYPLGFVKGDFVCGYSRNDDKGTTVSGEEITPMYKLVITNESKDILKEYQMEGLYIQRADVTDERIALQRMTKEGTVYSATSEDYITNNEDMKDSNIVLETYPSELYGTLKRLTYNEGITDTLPKILEPSLVINGKETILSLEKETLRKPYYVYGYGELAGGYETAREAISQADALTGVVTDETGQMVWERGNRDLVYTIPEIEAFGMTEGQSGKEACLSTLETYTDSKEDKLTDLTGCQTEQVLYLVNHNRPVVVLTGEDRAVLIVGYTDGTVSFVNPVNRAVESCSYADMDAMAAASGGVMLTGK